MENTSSIVLREVMMSDLPIFFDQQLDPEANWMAAFTRKDRRIGMLLWHTGRRF